MSKSFWFNLFSPFVPVLLFVATSGAFPGGGIASTQESPDPTPAKRQVVHPEVPRIPAKELAQLIKSKAEMVIVDTQAADGFEMWHIPTAVNIPYSSTANPTDRQLMLMALPMDKKIVIYCLCEEGTDSAKMALELRQLGFSDKQVRILEGGLILWEEKGYPMVKQRVAEQGN